MTLLPVTVLTSTTSRRSGRVEARESTNATTSGRGQIVSLKNPRRLNRTVLSRLATPITNAAWHVGTCSTWTRNRVGKPCATGQIEVQLLRRSTSPPDKSVRGADRRNNPRPVDACKWPRASQRYALARVESLYHERTPEHPRHARATTCDPH